MRKGILPSFHRCMGKGIYILSLILHLTFGPVGIQSLIHFAGCYFHRKLLSIHSSAVAPLQSRKIVFYFDIPVPVYAEISFKKEYKSFICFLDFLSISNLLPDPS